jgi:CRP-like cAMP-binding protein
MPLSADALRSVRLLAPLSDRDLRSLTKAMREHTFSPGDQLVVEGDPGVGFFVILDGSADVTIGGADIRTLGPGDYFGELALITSDTERSATITAGHGGVSCASMTAWEFRPFLREHPELAWTMLERLAELLRDAESRAL